MQRGKPTATSTPASAGPKLPLERSAWFEPHGSPCHPRPRMGELARSPDRADRPCPSHLLMADLRGLVSLPPPPLPPCLGAWPPPSWGLRHLHLQQVCRAVLWSPWQPPTAPLPLPGCEARRPSISRAPLQLWAGQGEASTKLPASLWVTGGTKEPAWLSG